MPPNIVLITMFQIPGIWNNAVQLIYVSGFISKLRIKIIEILEINAKM